MRYSRLFFLLRLAVLLGILVAVLNYTIGQRLESTTWSDPLPVIIYPINADGDPHTTSYIRSLNNRRFQPIAVFFRREAHRWGVREPDPLRVTLAPELDAPAPPEPGTSLLSRILWSLKIRYWAWRNTPDDGSNQRRVRVFVLYQQGKDNKPLAHSLGLQKGLLGIVNAYALKRQTLQNNIVIAHEIMHTVGARDRYDARGNPVYPEGYAEPGRKPLYPQRKAEIMAGRIALSRSRSRMPKRLKDVLVNQITAREIGWIDDAKAP